MASFGRVPLPFQCNAGEFWNPNGLPKLRFRALAVESLLRDGRHRLLGRSAAQ